MGSLLAPGQPVPWFRAAELDGNPGYSFDSVGGRWVVMLLLGSGGGEGAQEALRVLREHRAMFDDARACFFGVTIDPADAASGRIARDLPGIRWFLDYDRVISRGYGATPDGEARTYTPHWLLLDPMLRVRARAGLGEGPAVMAQLRRRLDQAAEAPQAPVFLVPGVLPRELCRELIAIHQRGGGIETGFMNDEGGRTVQRFDHERKRRTDAIVEDPAVLAALKWRLGHVLRPQIRRVFQFDASRVERFLVGCYDAETGGHFAPHRDNTTLGTAHRRFACTINLNADEYEGGDLYFPEFGHQLYRAPTGGAIVFSCSLMHGASRVTAGRRYAFLPFFYDEEGARIGERNARAIDPNSEGRGPG
jgi:predicted 2-oxoglutarate/Fe(II)-dependent dioxygenase YbiX